MNLLALLPGRDWLYICAFMVLLGGGIGFVHHERAVGAARVEAVRAAEHAQAAAVAASAIATNQAETNRRIAASQEIVHATIQQAQAVAADASAAASARDGLRNDLAAIRRSRTADPQAPAGSASAVDPAVVLAELLGRAADRATELAELADRRGVAGDACQRSYESLTPTAPQ
jgi:hypothetical protein